MYPKGTCPYSPPAYVRCTNSIYDHLPARVPAHTELHAHDMLRQTPALVDIDAHATQVFEFCERSVFDELDANPYGLPSRATKLLAWQLLHAAAYLHNRKVVAARRLDSTSGLGHGSFWKVSALCVPHRLGFCPHAHSPPACVHELGISTVHLQPYASSKHRSCTATSNRPTSC